jgi:hypothetical protein
MVPLVTGSEGGVLMPLMICASTGLGVALSAPCHSGASETPGKGAPGSCTVARIVSARSRRVTRRRTRAPAATPGPRSSSGTWSTGR